MPASALARGPYLSELHAVSQRRAVFDDSGATAYLYLTDANSETRIADAWVYNRVAAPTPEEARRFLPDPPPAAAGYVSENAFCADPMSIRWRIAWSRDGNSVALVDDVGPIACILSGRSRGYSRELIRSGPWGEPWSEAAYVDIFGVTA
jgi:hypothetical protein